MSTTTATTGYNSVQDWYASVTNASSASSTTKTADDQTTRFLKLLTTQLQNQDPTNPMDSAQMTSQLAQISTVTQLEKLNATMSTMQNSNQTGETLAAASLVGHSVLLKGTDLTLSKGVAVGGYELASEASGVTVSIKDSKGNVVRTLELGKQDAGVGTFAWDGKDNDGKTVEDGAYKIEVSAANSSGKVEATALQFSMVGGVVTTDGQLKIDVGSLGRVSMSDIKLIV